MLDRSTDGDGRVSASRFSRGVSVVSLDCAFGYNAIDGVACSGLAILSPSPVCAGSRVWRQVGFRRAGAAA